MARTPKNDPAEQGRGRRERILDAAFTTFAGRGYRDASMDDIASAAETSKGGVYFHFPTKESIFRELMRTTADKLIAKVEREVADEPDPIARAEIAIRTVLATFAGHRTMARLLFLDVIGAGRVFQAEANELHDRFARLIGGYLDQAIADGVIPATDTRVTSIAWFGALNEVVGPLAARRASRPARGCLSSAPRDAAAQRGRRRRPDRADPLPDRSGLVSRGAAMTVVDRDVRGGLAIRTEPVEPFDAIAVYAAAVEAGLEAALWVRPSEGFALVGIGRAWAVEADGPDRFAIADTAWRELVASAASARGNEGDNDGRGDLPRGVGPVLLGGLGFLGRDAGGRRRLGAVRCLVAGAARMDRRPDRRGQLGHDDDRGEHRARRPSPVRSDPGAGPGAGTGRRRPRRPAGQRAAGHRRGAPRRDALATDGRAVRRGRGSRPHRQGRAGPPGRHDVAGRPRRGECPPPPRGRRPGEHRLRVPARRPNVPGRHPGTAHPHGWPRRSGPWPSPGPSGVAPTRPRTRRSVTTCWRRTRIARSTPSSSMPSATA